MYPSKQTIGGALCFLTAELLAVARLLVVTVLASLRVVVEDARLACPPVPVNRHARLASLRPPLLYRRPILHEVLVLWPRNAFRIIPSAHGPPGSRVGWEAFIISPRGGAGPAVTVSRLMAK